MLLLQTASMLGGKRLVKVAAVSHWKGCQHPDLPPACWVTEALTGVLVKSKLMASFLQVVTDTLNFRHRSGPVKANMHTCMLHVEHVFHRSPKSAQTSNPS